jgi:hypothetical protein
MSEALFADDLYGGTTIKGGAGFKGFCHGSVGWVYERHDRDCKPGMWRVGTFAGSWDDIVEEFHPVLTGVNAVVDDFGNLRMVP